MGINIIVPAPGATINKSRALIQGILSNASGETGVIVNSPLGQRQGINFAAIVPLQQGQNSITAQATNLCGYKATDSITINTDTIQEPIRLTAIPSSGIPTLNVTLEAEASLTNSVSNYTWDFNGDGTPDQTGPTLSELTTQYQNPGLYFPKVTITDTQGNTYEETTIVNVLSREKMDNLLRNKWTSMIDALRRGDTKTALTQIATDSQASYKTMFSALSGQLSFILATAREFSLVTITDRVAKYKLLAIEGGKTYSYEVIFIMDENGLWKIKEF